MMVILLLFTPIYYLGYWITLKSFSLSKKLIKHNLYQMDYKEMHSHIMSTI